MMATLTTMAMEADVKIKMIQMHKIGVGKWLITTLLGAILPIGVAKAGEQCTGILTDHQQKGFSAMFTPAYSPGTVVIGDRVILENRFKRLSMQQRERLKTPTDAARYRLSEKHANLLKEWLNENSAASLPGWFTTVVGGLAPSAWMGITADIFLQMVNQSGDAGRLKIANIAGTVSPGGEVGVVEQVAPDKDGKPKFIWVYGYKYELNAKRVTVPLTVCTVDIASPLAGPSGFRFEPSSF